MFRIKKLNSISNAIYDYLPEDKYRVTDEGDKYDAILVRSANCLDMAMPDLSGSDVYYKLVELRPAIRTIICSGYEFDQTAAALVAAGVDASLMKPFKPNELAHLVRTVLDKSTPNES